MHTPAFKKRMEFYMRLFLLSIILFTLTGCGDKPNTEEKEPSVKSKQNNKNLEKQVLASNLNKLIGCDRLQFIFRNSDELQRLKIIENNAPNYNEVLIIDAISNDCSDLVLDIGSKLQKPWLLKANSNSELLMIILEQFKKPDLAYKILNYPSYTGQYNSNNVGEYFLKLVSTKDENGIENILASDLTKLIDEIILNRAINLAWYRGQNNLVYLLAKNTVDPPQKLGEGLKNITFEGTSFKNLDDHPDFKCFENGSYGYCSLQQTNILFKTIARIPFEGAGHFLFVNRKLAQIKMYLDLGDDDKNKLTKAISGKYKSTYKYIKSKPCSYGVRCISTDLYLWNLPTTDISLSMNKLLSSTRLHAGNESKAREDILELSFKDRVIPLNELLDAFIKKDEVKKQVKLEKEKQEKLKKHKALKADI